VKIKVNVSKKVFNPVYLPYLESDTYTQIYYGGSSSGKSYFLAQRCIWDMLKGGHNYLIVRKVARTVRKSVYNEITKAISFFQVSKLFHENKSDLVITGPNGYQIMFAGLDDVEKVKSITPAKGVITDIWVEEATEADYGDIKQLQKRLRGRALVEKRIILSFNPVYQTHWIYQEYFKGRWDDSSQQYNSDLLSILKTTYRDNTFLTDADKRELENERDPYFRDVYTNGNWGVLGKVIFKNWHVEDLAGKEETFDSFQNGLDFGYAEDPAALVRCHYDERANTLYVLDARYFHGLTNDLLAQEVMNLCGRDVVVCDSAEPKSIAELRQHGVTAIPAEKGKDSVNFGIQWLQKLNIVVNTNLPELVNELTVYKWDEDKDGNVLPKPIDRDNHLIDAIRYALFREMGWGARRGGNIRMPLAGAM
jgi:phage terminase large subunit